MKEFIEKLIGRLEELKCKYKNLCDACDIDSELQYDLGRYYGVFETISIANELAEEYKGGCCEWKKHRDYWESKCDYHLEENWFPEIFSVAPDEYHCPYCGKKIKVVG